MKTKIYLLLSLLVMSMFLFISCLKDEDQEEEQTDRYSFWKGDIENYYYILDMNDQKLHVVKGKPFMVLEYEPVSGVPLHCEFGLSEARNEYLKGVEGAIPEPFFSAGTLEYAEKLNLKGSVSLLCDSQVSTNKALSSEGFEFSIDKGADMWGHEILHFTFGIDSNMAGEIINNEVSWGGRVSDVKAFKLIRKFNSNSIK
jgi:hypothetical protein